MSEIDYYEILQVSTRAELEVIQAAYKRLSFKHHPDRNPGDGSAEQVMKGLNDAYQTLSDPARRQVYDAARQRMQSAPPPPTGLQRRDTAMPFDGAVIREQVAPLRTQQTMPMSFEGAVIQEQGVTFAVVIVKPYVIESRTEAAQAFSTFQPCFPGIPVVLMAQDGYGVPTYFGRPDIAEFLASVPLEAIPWKRYSVSA